jgi:hypothetical protein
MHFGPHAGICQIDWADMVIDLSLRSSDPLLEKVFHALTAGLFKNGQQILRPGNIIAKPGSIVA